MWRHKNALFFELFLMRKIRKVPGKPIVSSSRIRNRNLLKMDHNTFDPVKQHLLYQLSQHLLRMQLEAATLNSPTLPLSTPPSPFINWPPTPTTNEQGYFNWSRPMNFPSTPTLPCHMTIPTMTTQNGAPAPTRSPAQVKRGYIRWRESESEQK